MSDILIRGMELPKDGEMIAICIGYNGKVLSPINFPSDDALYQDTGKTATELPEHGRLIDADALFRTMNEVGWYSNADRDEVALEIVLDAKTIIPADGGEENG